MRRRILLLSALTTVAALVLTAPRGDRGPAILGTCPWLCAAEPGTPFDLERAKQILQKKQAGETLTSEEQQYLERARQEMQRRQAGDKAGGKASASTTPVSDPKMVAALVPLDELSGSYKGEEGGLYGGGRNTPPEAHQAAYLAESKKIRPLDASGKPSDNGKVVLLSIGMSNTTMEYSQFKKVADADPEKSPQVVVVDGGAQGGKTGAAWAIDSLALLPPGEEKRLARIIESRHLSAKKGLGIWKEVENRLKLQGVTAEQVQAVWIKHADAQPADLGEFPEHARFLQADIVSTLNVAKHYYPNLRVAYLSSRIFAGYATSPLNPEPYAYEGAFAVRWVIQDQIQGSPRLNYDPARGEVKSPIVAWGPYLWTNGNKPRKSDGLVWKEDDVVTTDHTHPSPSGRQKVAELLLKFFKSDPGSREWFVKH